MAKRSRLFNPESMRPKMNFGETTRVASPRSEGIGNSRVLFPPKSKTEEVVTAVNDLFDRNQNILMRNKVDWLHSMLYLNGQRNMDTLDYSTGTVTFYEGGSQGEEDQDFRERLKLEAVFNTYLNEVGHLMSLDLRPAVETLGASLDGVKKKSIAQLVFNQLLPEDKMRAIHSTVANYNAVLACCALGVYTKGTDILVEVIPPWELGSVPAGVPLPNMSGGIMRMRQVPLASIRAYYAPYKPDTKNLSPVEVPYGSGPTESFVGGNDLTTAVDDDWRPYRGSEKEAPKEGSSPWVWLKEVWIQNYAEELKRYIVVADDQLVLDQEISESERVPMPLHMTRYGCPYGFYGRSNLSGAISLNKEGEYMLTQLCANVENLDLYGKTLYPNSAGIDIDQLLRSESGGSFIPYSEAASPTGRGPTFFTVAPQNTGTLPGQVMGVVLNLLGNSSVSTPMSKGQAPGRVDSAAGLQLIAEASSIPMANPSSSLREAFVGMYRALLYAAKTTWPDNQPLSLTLLDETLAGVTFDDRSGGILVTKNMIPHPNEVQIGIISEVPVSKAALEMGLRENLRSGIIDPQDFRIQCRKMGLNTPVGNDAEWENYRNAVRENIIMYGDGKTPGPVNYAMVSETDMHDVHLKVILRFMGSPEYAMASDEVKDAFLQHYRDHRTMTGQLPMGMPNPDEMTPPISPEEMGMGGMLEMPQ